jgi:D-tyrosyl-tRNA(Tyr) deacylase
MRILVQRSLKSSVSVDNKVVGTIDRGLVLLVGFTHTDTVDNINKLVQKVLNLRIFDDEDGVMNKSILDVGGSILSISQFTLYADTTQGNRPSFINAAKPDYANELYEYFMNKCKEEGLEVEKGIFGAHMNISLVNSGPVTIMLEK